MLKILYLINHDYHTEVVTKEECFEVVSLYSFLNQLASYYLTSIDGYRKSVKKQLGMKYNIPLFFSKSLLLFSLSDQNRQKYWINYYALNDIYYQKGEFIFVFYNGHRISMIISKGKISNSLNKIKAIIDYINKF